MHKRIILVGPAAAGKDFLKKKFKNRGFILDTSYTTRSPREGEVDGIDYHFTDLKTFEHGIKNDWFYERVKHGEYYYATGNTEWNECDIFIMETEGIAAITPEDRKSCFVIYLNIPEHERIRRMRMERKWEYPKIQERLDQDKEKFSTFKDYDLLITDPKF